MDLLQNRCFHFEDGRKEGYGSISENGRGHTPKAVLRTLCEDWGVTQDHCTQARKPGRDSRSCNACIDSVVSEIRCSGLAISVQERGLWCDSTAGVESLRVAEYLHHSRDSSSSSDRRETVEYLSNRPSSLCDFGIYFLQLILHKDSALPLGTIALHCLIS